MVNRTLAASATPSLRLLSLAALILIVLFISQVEGESGAVRQAGRRKRSESGGEDRLGSITQSMPDIAAFPGEADSGL